MTSASYAPALAAGTRYYWQVTAKNASGSTAGAVWSFTTVVAPPSRPAATSPSTGAVVPVGTLLSWTAAGADSYTVRFGTNGAPPVVATGLAAQSFRPILMPGRVYFWNVTAVNAGGSTTSPTWWFETPTADPYLFIEDQFDAVDGTVISARTPTFNRGNAVWTSAGDGPSPEIRESAAAAPAGSGTSMVALRHGLERVLIAAQVTIGSGASRAGLVFRHRDADNFWMVRPRGNLLEFVERRAGVDTAVWDWPIPTPLPGSTHTLSVRLDGVVMLAAWDGVLVGYPSAFLMDDPGAGLLWDSTSATDRVERFTVKGLCCYVDAPGTPRSLGPESGEAEVVTTAKLTWAAPRSVSYDVAFGTSATPPTVATGLKLATYTPALAPGTTYYWRVTARGPDAMTTGPVWSFTTATLQPATPAGQSPAVGAEVGLGTTLSWTGVRGVTYDVAFGTTGAPPTVAMGLTTPSYKPTLA
ncbi:MAG: hypothetical protein ABL982_26640, partial [Vicinamibacterales bacterium]